MRTRVQVPRCLIVLSFGLTASSQGCGREPIAAPVARTVGSTASSAKSSAALAVTSTTPAFGDQGTTVDVHILGSGFTAGAQAKWLLNGVADDHVHTNSTTYISSSELVANITIASDAQTAFWDVQVSLSNGKNGVGSDCFEVTSAEVLGTGSTGGDMLIEGISEQLQVVGYSGSVIGFVYDDAGGWVNLGKTRQLAVDPWGTLAAGVDENFVPTVWIRQSPSTWVAEQLPELPSSNGARVEGAARAPDGTVLLAGLDDSALSTQRNAPHYYHAVLWRQSGSGWAAPITYALPAGSVQGHATDVNGRAQIAGVLDGGSGGAVWEDSVTPTRLDGLAQAINESGTLVVGSRSGTPVYWWRDPATNTWHTTGVPLPSIASTACTGSSASDVNSAGVIVGSTCNADGKLQGTVWLLDLSGATPVLVGNPTALPGLGTKSTTATDVSIAEAVTESAPYVVAGGARSNGTRLAVRWRLR